MLLPDPFPSYYLPRAALASSRLVSPAKGDAFACPSGKAQARTKVHAHLAVAHAAHSVLEVLHGPEPTELCQGGRWPPLFR